MSYIFQASKLSPGFSNNWNNGASSLEREGKEAKQLESLSRKGDIDKVIGKGTQVDSCHGGMEERCPFKEDTMCNPWKWTIVQRSFQYLRELAVLEVIYSDLDKA